MYSFILLFVLFFESNAFASEGVVVEKEIVPATSSNIFNKNLLMDSEYAYNHFSLSYSNPYEIEDYNEIDFSGAYGNESVFSFAFQKKGLPYYCLYNSELGYSYNFGSYFDFETKGCFSALKYDLPETKGHYFFADLSLSFDIKPFPFLYLSFYSEDLIYSIKNFEEENYYYSCGVKVMPFQGVSLEISMLSPYNEVSLFYKITAALLPEFVIESGYISKSGEKFSGLTWVWANTKISYKLSEHPFLGKTHSLKLTYCFDSVKYCPVKYDNYFAGQPLTENDYIDIDNCTEVELEKLDTIDSELAKRIVALRKYHGLITVYGLQCAGCTPQQIDDIRVHSLYEIKAKPEKKKYSPAKKKYKTKKRTSIAKSRPLNKKKGDLLLKKLVASGIPLSQAYRISSKALVYDYTKLKNYIRFSKVIEDKYKDKAVKVCAEFY